MTTRTVSTLTGASLRRLQWWCEIGIVQPRMISPRERVWSREDARRVSLAIQLRKKGIPLSGIRSVVAALPQKWSFAVTDGGAYTVFPPTTSAAVVAVMEAPRRCAVAQVPEKLRICQEES